MRGINLTVGKADEEKKEVESVRTGLNSSVNNTTIFMCNSCGVEVTVEIEDNIVFINPCKCSAE